MTAAHPLDDITADMLVAALDALKFERGRAAKKGDDIAVRLIDAAMPPLKALIDADKCRKTFTPAYGASA